MGDVARDHHGVNALRVEEPQDLLEVGVLALAAEMHVAYEAEPQERRSGHEGVRRQDEPAKCRGESADEPLARNQNSVHVANSPMDS